MKIRARFNLIFTLLATIALMFFGITVYWVSKNNRAKEFSSIIKNKALIKSNLILDTNLSVDDLQQIYDRQLDNTDSVNIAIYDANLNQVYSDKPILSTTDSIRNILQKTKTETEYIVRNNINQTIGLTFQNNGKDYFLLASSSDTYGKEKLSELL